MLMGTTNAAPLFLGTNNEARMLINTAGDINMYGTLGVGDANPNTTRAINAAITSNNVNGYGINSTDTIE